MRVAYDTIAFQANLILTKMAFSSSYRESCYWWNSYLTLLSSYGWTDQLFDSETIRRIDESWEVNLQISN